MLDAADEDVQRCARRVGTTLCGKWRIDALLGIGGMAAVYAASHRMGSRAAIKVLHPFVAVSKEMRARFEQEAKAVTALGHEAAVRVFDVDKTEDGAPFLVMELLSGESVGQRADRGALDVQSLLMWMSTLLEVLVKAHALGIVHRDIKPDNLFVTADGKLKVLDFGIARIATGSSVHTKTGAMLGTTAYMAPEQIHGREIDGRADLFAVGATMFRLLTNRRIHEATNDAELLIKMGTTPAPALSSVAPNIDPRLAHIVDRALEFDRDHRYPNATAMLDDLRALTSGSGPVVLPAAVASAPHSPTGASAVFAVPTRAEPSLVDRLSRTAVRVGGVPIPILVGVAALFLLLGGIAMTAVVMSSAEKNLDRSSKDEASGTNARRTPDEADDSAPKKTRRQEMDAEFERLREPDEPPPKKGKGKGKAKKR